jgi:hypothetical protein
MWIAACRRYVLLGEFAEEVVGERLLLLKPYLHLSDFDAFIRVKALWHPELDTLAVTTRRKLRQNSFRMLREAGLLAEDGAVLNAFLTPRLVELLEAREPSDLRLFPRSQGWDR